MAQGTASEGSSGENITHFSSMRIRVTGAIGALPPYPPPDQPQPPPAQLRLKIYSYDDVRSKDLVAYPAATRQRVIPTRLINFMEQRASIELKTTGFDERFRINRITIFTKEVFKEYPQ